MKFFVMLQYGEPVPRMYGCMWRVPNLDARLFCPIPFNVVARAFYRLKWWLYHPWYSLDTKFLIEELESENAELRRELGRPMKNCWLSQRRVVQ